MTAAAGAIAIAAAIAVPLATVGSGEAGTQRLAPVLQQLKRTNAAVAASSRVRDPGQVFFFDARHARVATITHTFEGNGGGLKGLNVVNGGTGWKVSQADFCGLIQMLVPACPPR